MVYWIFSRLGTIMILEKILKIFWENDNMQNIIFVNISDIKVIVN